MRVPRVAALLVIVALVGVAEGQNRRKRHKPGGGETTVTANPGKDKAPPKQTIAVSGFSPQEGPAGTRVTISGSGFIKQDKVIVGGRPVKAESISDTAIVFEFPGRGGDGSIVIRHPGNDNDVVVGTFNVFADQAVSGFSPTSGPVGTRVEIIGSGFRSGDQVLFNGKSLAVVSLEATRIVVTVPEGATDDYFTVVRAGGDKVRSRKKFQVSLPPPVISDFSPKSGSPGTLVRVTGSNFTNADKVYYGSMRLAPSGFGEGWVEVKIPLNAKKSELIIIKSARGDVATAREFSLILNAVVNRFNPTSGGPGTKVTIHGDGFISGDTVMFDGQKLNVLSLKSSEIVVRIPEGVKDDVFTVYREGVAMASTAGKFSVLSKPTISSFTPSSGSVGTRVTITGTNFIRGVRVKLGGKELRLESFTADTLVVEIPRRAGSGAFTVITDAGEAMSAQTFTVQVRSRVTRISPTSGPVGTRVTISGKNFNSTDVFYLGSITLPIVERRSDAYVIEIPQSAMSGVIEWESYGERQATRFRFEVVSAATMSSFSPSSGTVGEKVTILGNNFTGGAQVFFGTIACQVKRRDSGKLVVIVPAGASGSDYFYVEDSGTRLKSSSMFEVVAAPGVSSLSPLSGPAGTKVTISGSNFSAGVKVWFGSLSCAIVSRTESQIVVTIPASAKGKDYLVVDDRGGRVQSSQLFAVLEPPTEPPDPSNDGHHEHAHTHPHEVGDHHHHPHAHPHRTGATHHHPF